MIMTVKLLQFFKNYTRAKTKEKKIGERFFILDLFNSTPDENFADFGFSMVEISELTRAFPKENADIVKRIGKRQRGSTHCTLYERI